MASTIRRKPLSVQVCVPAAWSDEQVKAWADQDTPCGTENGWIIRREREFTDGSKERVECEGVPNHVHIVLDA